MIVASVALALVIGAAFATLLVTINGARSAEREARHSQGVLLAAYLLEQRVLDLERGQRGFLLTRQATFLEPWQQARSALPGEGRALLALVHGERDQEARVRAIIAAARSYVNDYSVPLVRMAERGDPAAKTIPETAEGEARVDAIRADFAQLLDAERRTAASTARASKSDARRAYAGAAIGIGASIALVALYAGYLSNAIVKPIRHAATVTGRLAGGDLAARLPETGVGEIGALEHAFNAMGESLERGRDELAALVDEQAALRRVATRVAEGAPPDELLAAVAAEIGRLLPAAYALIGRYDLDGAEVTAVGRWSRTGDVSALATKAPVLDGDVPARVWKTRRAARVNPVGAAAGSTVGVPITVQGRLWGLVVAASADDETLPPDTESRLGRFTDLVSTAIANAEAEAALAASRARLVLTADETRRRFERDLHDGAQQLFVAAALRLRGAQAAVPPDAPELAAELERVAVVLGEAIEKLRDFAQGIHPVILAEGGLRPALRKLAHQSPVSVELDVQTNGRLPESVEVAAYYVVSEALVNAAKHAQASTVAVRVEAAPERLHLRIEDDGVGGARFGRGSGLIGIKDRVEALGGRVTLRSEAASGTSLSIELPIEEEEAV
jgi:signal transduction histidine kinase